MSNTTTTTKTVGPHSHWDPASNKTITIRAVTWKRLQKYFDHFGSTFDSVITQILDEKEKRESRKEERSF